MERGACERVEALLQGASALGAGSLRLSLFTGNGERVVDGTPLLPLPDLRSWLGEAMVRYRTADPDGRFRLRVLDAGGRAAGSAVVRFADIPEVVREAALA